nr:MAG TPA: hypothetical protein [Caudoviricetes sp.]
MKAPFLSYTIGIKNEKCSITLCVCVPPPISNGIKISLIITKEKVIPFQFYISSPTSTILSHITTIVNIYKYKLIDC